MIKIKPKRPKIYSSLTGWLGKSMLTMAEYCYLIDKKKVATLNKLKFGDIKNFEFQINPNTPSINDTFGTSMHSLIKKKKAE